MNTPYEKMSGHNNKTMKKFYLIFLVLCSNVHAQDSTTAINLGTRINYINEGAFIFIHPKLIAGIGIEELNLNGLIGYNKLFTYEFKTLPDTLSIDYVSLGFNVQYRILERYRLSPLADFTIGTGLKSKKSRSTDLTGHGNPNYDPDEDLGKFIRVSFYSSFLLMADVSFDRLSIQAGGGFKFTRIHKEQKWNDNRSHIDQKHFELSIAAVYKLPLRKNK